MLRLCMNMYNYRLTKSLGHYLMMLISAALEADEMHCAEQTLGFE
eukprot:XP_001706238.1 Hypothetical protein GL50803_2978 [Giardia lamblia ATCC 50803]